MTSTSREDTPRAADAGVSSANPLFGASALSSTVRHRTRSMVDEYSGALPPGRVIVVAVETLRSALHHGHIRDALLDEWQASTRRRLSAEVAVDLARRRRPAPA